MDFRSHVVITGSALRDWFVAQTEDGLAVACLWLVGLLILHIPLWFVWVPLAFVFQFIPQFGTLISLIGPFFAALVGGGLERALYVLILYAVIVVIDGLVLQPVIMRRTAKIPIWASLLMPLALALTPLGFWGLLLAPPLLAIIFAYRRRRKQQQPEVEIIPPPRRMRS